MKTEAAVRANLREWWPELLCVALLIAIALAGQKDDPLFAAFVAIIGGIFWGMGHRHRGLPLHRKVDRMTDAVGEMVDEMKADREPEPREQGPRLRLIRGKGDTA